MSSISWTATSGNWNTKADWSGGAEPNATSDVIIDVSGAITVTYSAGADSILSLTTGYNNTLDVTGGSLAVLGNSSLEGAVDQSGGTLSLGGKTNLSYAGIQQSAGTLKIASGTLVLEGQNDSFDGTVTGGALDCVNGTISIGVGAVLSVKQFVLHGSKVTLAGPLTEAGLYEQIDGTLSIGSTLKLSGTSALMGGAINGAGTLDLSGTTEIDGTDFDGTGSINNTGKILQDGGLGIDNNSGSATLINSATGTWVMVGDVSIAADTATTNTLVTNRGLLEKVSGTGTTSAQIDPSFTSSGNLEIAAGTLVLKGHANNLSGTIGGAGVLEFDLYGTTTLAKSLTDTVGTMLLQEGATVDLGASLSYGGTLDAIDGTLGLQSDTLTLTGLLSLGGCALDGKGTIASSDSNIDGGVIEGSVLLQNSGTMVLSGDLVVGENSGDSAKLQNSSTGTVLLETGGSIDTRAAGQFINAGTVMEAAGDFTSVISADLSSTGTLEVATGEMVLQGANSALNGDVTGAGLLEFQGTTTIGGGTTLGIAALTLSFGTLVLDGNDSFAGTFTQAAGTLALGAGTLILSGSTSFGDGLSGGGLVASTSGGTLALAGDTTILDGLEADGNVVLYNTGTITNLSASSLGDYSSDTASLNNAQSGTLLLSDFDIGGNSGSSILNAGTIAKTLGGAGAAQISPTVVNTGTISVSQGTLSFLGAVSGSGRIIAGAGTELSFGTGVSGGSVTLGAYADLAVNATDGFADKIAGFAAGDIIELNELEYFTTPPTFSFSASTDKLTVSNGSSSITLSFSGSYSSSSFALFNDGGNVGIVHT